VVALLLAGVSGAPGSAAVAPQDKGKVGRYMGAESCQLCHDNGPKGIYDADLVRLDEYATWKKMDKHSQAYEVLVPKNNFRAEGKVVTHEMYAAGHPPLPGFELATFSESLPKHWRLMKDVPLMKKLDAKVRKEVYHYEVSEMEQTRLVAVGALVSLRDAMRLL